MANPAMESALLKMPAVPAEAQVREVLLKSWLSTQLQQESLTLVLAFQMLAQSTWQLKVVEFQMKPERHSHWSVWVRVQTSELGMREHWISQRVLASFQRKWVMQGQAWRVGWPFGSVYLTPVQLRAHSLILSSQLQLMAQAQVLFWKPTVSEKSMTLQLTTQVPLSQSMCSWQRQVLKSYSWVVSLMAEQLSWHPATPSLLLKQQPGVHRHCCRSDDGPTAFAITEQFARQLPSSLRQQFEQQRHTPLLGCMQVGHSHSLMRGFHTNPGRQPHSPGLESAPEEQAIWVQSNSHLLVSAFQLQLLPQEQEQRLGRSGRAQGMVLQSMAHLRARGSHTKPPMQSQELQDMVPTACSAWRQTRSVQAQDQQLQVWLAGQGHCPKLELLLELPVELPVELPMELLQVRAMSTTLICCQTQPMRRVPSASELASQRRKFSLQQSLLPVPGQSPTPSKQSKEQQRRQSGMYWAILAFLELMGWMSSKRLKKEPPLSREKKVGEEERKPTRSSVELLGLNWREVMDSQLMGGWKLLRGTGWNWQLSLSLVQVQVLRAEVEAMTMYLPSRLKSQNLAFQTICGNSTLLNPVLRYITIVCPTSTTSCPSGLAFRSYTLAWWCSTLQTCRSGDVRQKMMLLTVARAMKESLLEVGMKVMKCLSVVQVLQMSMVSSLVQVARSQQSRRQIHWEELVESWRVMVAKLAWVGLIARLEVMLVGMVLEMVSCTPVAMLQLNINTYIQNCAAFHSQHPSQQIPNTTTITKTTITQNNYHPKPNYHQLQQFLNRINTASRQFSPASLLPSVQCQCISMEDGSRLGGRRLQCCWQSCCYTTRLQLRIIMDRVRLLVIVIALAQAQPHPRRPIRNLLHPYEPIEILVTLAHQQQLLYQHTIPLHYQELQSAIELPLQLTLDLPLASNLTLEASLYRIRGIHGKQLVSTARRNLTRYQKIRSEGEEGSASSYDPMDEVQSLSQARTARETETKYDIHIPQDFHLMLVWSEFAFPEGQLQPQHRLELTREEGSTYYLPPLDLGQLYIPTTKAKPLRAGPTTVKLSVFTISYQKYIFFYSIGHPEQFSKDLGVLAEYLDLKEEAMDEMKEFMFENPPWLIALYFLLSLAEIVLKFATIKSEFRFWKDIDKNKGVSLKTLFFELAAEVVLLLYLYEYDAGKIILVFHVLDILVTLWKISRTYSITVGPRFPFLRLATSELYRQREKLDGNAVWYMNYLLVPLMAVYVGYALHKRGWRVVEYYRFGLETGVAFIAIFGFILMTPQLYINYKLKSVEHLNWRGLVYRFVTTIIDDVFAFMVTMPALRRMMYFRDDIIFLVYVYQRYIYKVDYERKTIFTIEQVDKNRREEKQELNTLQIKKVE